MYVKKFPNQASVLDDCKPWGAVLDKEPSKNELQTCRVTFGANSFVRRILSTEDNHPPHPQNFVQLLFNPVPKFWSLLIFRLQSIFSTTKLCWCRDIVFNLVPKFWTTKLCWCWGSLNRILTQLQNFGLASFFKATPRWCLRVVNFFLTQLQNFGLP